MCPLGPTILTPLLAKFTMLLLCCYFYVRHPHVLYTTYFTMTKLFFPPSKMYIMTFATLIFHYSDVVMGAMASQITSLVIVYSTVFSGDQRKHQSSASLTFVRVIVSIWWRHHVHPMSCNDSLLASVASFTCTWWNKVVVILACRCIIDFGNLYLTAMGHLLFHPMMTSSNGNILRVTGHLCGEFTGPRWIPHTKASDAEFWCLLWSAPE